MNVAPKGEIHRKQGSWGRLETGCVNVNVNVNGM